MNYENDVTTTVKLSPNAGMNPKQRGNLRRKVFIDELRNSGIKLTNIEEVLYKTETGGLIGIASATESTKPPGRWFLGLPVQNYDQIVLLCEKRDRTMLSFVFPKDFLQSHIHNISQDARGQYKFNVVHKSGK
jgi:hypothetical protein